MRAIAAGRAREQLVPRRARRERPLDGDLEVVAIPRRGRPIRQARHHRGDDLVGRHHQLARHGLARRQRCAQRGHRLRQHRIVGRRRHATPRRLDQQRAFEQLDRDIDPAGDLALEAASPGRERIDPRDHRIVMATERRQRDRRAPRIVADVGQLGLAPLARARRQVEQRGAQHVVAVADQVSLDGQRLADHALDGIASAVDLGPHGQQDHPPAQRISQPRQLGRRDLWLARHRHASLPAYAANPTVRGIKLTSLSLLRIPSGSLISTHDDRAAAHTHSARLRPGYTA